MCAQKLHWHVQNANSVTTTQQKIRKHIPTGWKLKNTANSAEPTHYTKKRSKGSLYFGKEYIMGDSAKTDKTPKPNFFQGVKTEFKKIAWPDKDSLLKQSVAVVCISVVAGAIIAVLDFLFQYGIDFLTTL